MVSLLVYSHNGHSNKQDEKAHAFHSGSINCLFMKTAILLDEIDELRELSNANNAHLTRSSETFIFSQITDQKLTIPSISLFDDSRKTRMRDEVALYLRSCLVSNKVYTCCVVASNHTILIAEHGITRKRC